MKNEEIMASAKQTEEWKVMSIEEMWKYMKIMTVGAIKNSAKNNENDDNVYEERKCQWRMIMIMKKMKKWRKLKMKIFNNEMEKNILWEERKVSKMAKIISSNEKYCNEMNEKYDNSSWHQCVERMKK